MGLIELTAFSRGMTLTYTLIVSHKSISSFNFIIIYSIISQSHLNTTRREFVKFFILSCPFQLQLFGYKLVLNCTEHWMNKWFELLEFVIKAGDSG